MLNLLVSVSLFQALPNFCQKLAILISFECHFLYLASLPTAIIFVIHSYIVASHTVVTLILCELQNKKRCYL
jgi:hypothetical protein